MGSCSSTTAGLVADWERSAYAVLPTFPGWPCHGGVGWLAIIQREQKTVWDLLIWWLGHFCLLSPMVNLDYVFTWLIKDFFRDFIKLLQPWGNDSQFDDYTFQTVASTANYCCRFFPIFLWLPWILLGRVSVPCRVFGEDLPEFVGVIFYPTYNYGQRNSIWYTQQK